MELKNNVTKSIACVDKNGKVLESSGSPLPVYSITKTFIAAVIIEMKIDLKKKISTWFDKSFISRGDEITVEQLLNHTSGIRDYGNIPDYINGVKNNEYPWSDEKFADYTLCKSLLFEPGCGWSYSNPGFYLLSKIAQKESGLNFDGVIRKYITEPLGLKNTSTAHGIFSDLLPEYRAEWVWHGLIISSAEDVAGFMASDLVLPLAKHPVKVPFEHPLWVSPHYGYGLMIEPGICYGHEGGGPGYNSACFKFIENELTWCVLMASEKENEALKHLRILSAENF